MIPFDPPSFPLPFHVRPPLAMCILKSITTGKTGMQRRLIAVFIFPMTMTAFAASIFHKYGEENVISSLHS